MSEKKLKIKTGENELLRPAFETHAQALAFLALIVFALALPVLITKAGLVERRDSYRIMPENQGAYSFAEHEIFEQDEDIDILFIGSSVLWNAVDTPQIQRELSTRLGRQARVVTFGHYFNSIDISYMQLRDLLERKRVRMVVLSIPRMPFTEGPSTTAYKFIRYSDDAELFDALPPGDKIPLYACSVLRAPRDLLTLVRPNLSAPSPYAEDLGADKAKMGMGRSPRQFEIFTPTAPAISTESLIYSPENQSRYRFTNEDLSPYQKNYLKELVEMLRLTKVPLLMLNIPQYSEKGNKTITERKNWTEEFSADIPLVGIAPAELYAGLGDEEIERLHYDDEHMNANGSEFFTRAVAPAILKIYEQHIENQPEGKQ